MKHTKLIALLLALVMVLSLAACGGEPAGTTGPAGTTKPAQTTVPPETDPAQSEDGHVTPEELGSGTVKWSEKKTADGWMLVTNEGGDTLGYSPDSGVQLIQVDGYAFKDLDRDGKLDVYEDWRQSNEDRATNLTMQMTVEEMTPLFTHGGWMNVASEITEDSSDYAYIVAGGRSGVTRSSIGEGSTSIAVAWANALQALCEATGNWGIPGLTSVDPNHISGSIDQNSLASTFSTEEAFKLGVSHGKQYRAVGVHMLLGPQVDIGTQPTWTRATGAYTEDPALSRDIAQAYISGLQSTWAEDGTDLGWGSESVYAIAKHYAGAGASEGGRNDHMDAGKYTVFPGNNYGAHLIPFFDGAWNLTDSSTGFSGVMPNYGISVSRDGSLGELVGGAYSEFKMGMLEDNGYEGYIVTDWQITNDGQQPFGVEEYTKAERFAMLYATGNDAVGGTSETDMAAEGFEIYMDEVGEETAMARLRDLTYSFVYMEMQLELFENPYVDLDHAVDTVWNAQTDAESKAQQEKAVIMLKNSDNTIAANDGTKKTVYVPFVFSSGSAGSSSGEPEPAGWSAAMDLAVVGKYFNVVTDTVGEPSGTDEEGNAVYTEADIVRAPAADIAACDMILVPMDAPSSDSSQDAEGNWIPASLQFEEYTATAARRESLAGDVTVETVNDGYYGTKTEEKKQNRSYYGNTAGKASNYSDLELLRYANSVKGDAKVVTIVSKGSGPSVMVFSEVEPLSDVILYYYGTSSWFFEEVLLEVVNGDTEPSALLPFQMPASMDAVEVQDDDVPRDVECYVDADGNVYDFAFGLNWSGKIEDERVATYSVPALTSPTTISYNP